LGQIFFGTQDSRHFQQKKTAARCILMDFPAFADVFNIAYRCKPLKLLGFFQAPYDYRNQTNIIRTNPDR